MSARAGPRRHFVTLDVRFSSAKLRGPMPHAALRLRPDPALSLRDPEGTALGRAAIAGGLELLNELGLEAFTFRKLAGRIDSTEVSLYKYFPNKHRLLQYHFQLYWLWLRQMCGREVEEARDAKDALRRCVEAICGVWPRELPPLQVDPHALRRLVIERPTRSSAPSSRRGWSRSAAACPCPARSRPR